MARDDDVKTGNRYGKLIKNGVMLPFLRIRKHNADLICADPPEYEGQTFSEKFLLQEPRYPDSHGIALVICGIMLFTDIVGQC